MSASRTQKACLYISASSVESSSYNRRLHHLVKKISETGLSGAVSLSQTAALGKGVADRREFQRILCLQVSEEMQHDGVGRSYPKS